MDNMRKIVTNIEWDIYIDDAFEILNDMPRSKVADIFGTHTINMTTDELYDYAYDVWRHSPAELEEFMGLPDTVDVPGTLEDDEIANYLSDQYGFCIRNFEL